MKLLISTLIFVLCPIAGFSQVAAPFYSTDGLCVGKDDPNYDVLCSRYSDDFTCESYPLCRWVEGETIRELLKIEGIPDDNDRYYQ